MARPQYAGHTWQQLLRDDVPKSEWPACCIIDYRRQGSPNKPCSEGYQPKVNAHAFAKKALKVGRKLLIQKIKSKSHTTTQRICVDNYGNQD